MFCSGAKAPADWLIVRTELEKREVRLRHLQAQSCADLAQKPAAGDQPGMKSRGTAQITKMARDMSDKEILKMELDQLKKEVSTPRTPVNANCADTIQFVEGLLPNDPLIKGVSDDKNPYKGDKGGCIIT
ncbi:unnamed protein product [Pleuronectes platessa]|uniref:Guanine nucleotide-binding protein subunit gamma n=2 Tax=Pleuronectes platessa TaxID=8262 RepID=A0A9N7UX24_PLEPL|nr:unnamed protein product [Pleuronectes platessa]